MPFKEEPVNSFASSSNEKRFEVYGRLEITLLVPTGLGGEFKGDFFGGQLRVFLDRLHFEKRENRTFWDIGEAFRNAALLFNDKRAQDFAPSEKMAVYSDFMLSKEVTSSFELCISG